VLQPPGGLGLQAVALPDFSLMQEPVRRQMLQQYSRLASLIGSAPGNNAELGAAYGDMGRLLMAATDFDAAEVCYLNAQTLVPGDKRWPYYLGHIYRVKGPPAQSASFFERALELEPNDVATLVWLGDAYLTQGRPQDGEPLFAKALSLEPSSPAARYGAGRAALATKDFSRAVKDLESAIASDPRATAAHYPLAMAYRGLGNVAQAEAHLAKQGDIQPRLADPLMWELDELLQSPEAYNVRGGRYLEAGNWAVAAELFRRGLELAPSDTSLRHRLGTALFQMGAVRGAVEEFERVLRTAPDHARAHFSLGVILRDSGRHDEAIERFSTALKHEPGYVQARVQLAGVLARSGRPGEALDHFRQALDADPTLADASFGYAMALVRLRRYQEARDRLIRGAREAPAARAMFDHALARLLAAAPDDRVRDGGRAKALVDNLLKTEQSLQLAETTAMMLAELGQYAQAAAVQRDALTAAEKARADGAVRRLTENLKLYERGEPCRRPFTDEELP
jgi:tetratricopeptide (TPR) repeat protein